MSSFKADIDRVAAERAFAAGDLEAAGQACQRMLKRNKRDARALHMLGKILVQQGKYADAESRFRQCAKLNPRDPALHLSMSEPEFLLGHFDEAIRRIDKALKIKPAYDLALLEKAKILERSGQIDAAKHVLAQLKPRPELRANALMIQCTVALADDDPQAAADLSEPALTDDSLQAETRGHVLGLRGKALNQLGDPDGAMEAWILGNHLRGVPFDEDAYRRRVDSIIKFFSPAMMRALPRATNDEELPILIAGLPRSGTTLVEQIIDAHPRGHGAGELTEIDMIVHMLPTTLGSYEPYPGCARALTEDVVDRLADEHLAVLRNLGGPLADRVVNKSLYTYEHLGLIAQLFPKARIIYCRRDLMDVGLSIFMNEFNPRKHPYTFDLSHIGLVCRSSELLMAHWREVIDLPVLEVQYETLVAEGEPRIREIIDFCGLEWDSRCAQFHSSGRSVMTASYQQVSKPMYTSAVKRYERYGRHLDPLRQALETDA